MFSSAICLAPQVGYKGNIRKLWQQIDQQCVPSERRGWHRGFVIQPQLHPAAVSCATRA